MASDHGHVLLPHLPTSSRFPNRGFYFFSFHLLFLVFFRHLFDIDILLHHDSTLTNTSFCFTDPKKDKAVSLYIHLFSDDDLITPLAVSNFAMLSAYCERRRLRFDFRHSLPSQVIPCFIFWLREYLFTMMLWSVWQHMSMALELFCALSGDCLIHHIYLARFLC